MQKNHPSSHFPFRISSHHSYHPSKTQPWKSLHPKFSKHQILSSLSKIKQPSYLTLLQIQSYKSNENKIIKDLQNSFQLQHLDKPGKPLIGSNCINEFYKHYKKLPKIINQNQYENVSPSIYTKLLRKSEELEVLPLKLGVIKERGVENHINVEESLYGRKYMEVLLQGTQSLPITQCNFNGTRFSQYSKTKFLSPSQPLLKDIQILKLQKNSLSNFSIQSVHLLFQNTSKLIELDLGNNRLNDNGVLNLCEILQNNSKIKILNLSKNGLTDRCIKGIIGLDKGNGMEEIYLQWNKIGSGGGKELLDYVVEGESGLKVLDMSWNLLGGDDGLCQSVGRVMRENREELYHLNLGNNRFTREECERIADELKGNHTLYGFHFEGHYGYIDSRGYLKLSTQDSSDQPYIKLNPTLKTPHKQKLTSTLSSFPPPLPDKRLSSHRSNSLLLKQKLPSKPTTTHKPLLLKNICWLCSNWIQHEFTLQLDDLTEPDKPIYIHFSFDDFEGVYVGKKGRGEKSQISYVGMIPPVRFEFFWTIGEEYQLSSRYPIQVMKQGYCLKGVKVGEKVVGLVVERRNWYETPNRKGKGVVDGEMFPETVKPRMNKIQEENENDTTPPADTSPEQTLFKHSYFETPVQKPHQLLQKFQHQWSIFLANQTLLTDPDELLSCKSVFSQNYPLLRDIYRHYGSYSQLTLPTIIFDSKCVIKLLVDYEMIEGEFGEGKVDEILLGMCGENDRYCDMIEGVGRPGLFEIVCRVVSIRYDGLDIVEGIKLLMETLQMNSDIFESFNKWRDRVLFLEGLHKQLKKYSKKFELLFKTLTKSSPSPDLLPFTSFFRYFSNKLLFGKPINTIQIKRAVYYSQGYQDVDGEGRVGIGLSFGEFVEAVGRLGFVDGEGELVEEFSLVGRKDRLQKVIDLVGMKGEGM